MNNEEEIDKRHHTKIIYKTPGEKADYMHMVFSGICTLAVSTELELISVVNEVDIEVLIIKLENFESFAICKND